MALEWWLLAPPWHNDNLDELLAPRTLTTRPDATEDCYNQLLAADRFIPQTSCLAVAAQAIKLSDRLKWAIRENLLRPDALQQLPHDLKGQT